MITQHSLARRLLRDLALLVFALAPRAAAQTSPQCPPEWIPTFGGWPLNPSYDNSAVHALAAFDDGHGHALYAARGSSVSAPASVMRWDGWGWRSIVTTNMGRILALASYDSGSGARLYAAGEFTSIGNVAANHIASFDGTTWSPVGVGTNGSAVCALRVFDDGSGPQLYAGGNFTSAGGFASQYLARWNGASWSSLSTGFNAAVHSLAVFDDGSGSALYAGGLFANASGQPCNHIARWSGSAWNALGSGMAGGGATNTTVKSLEVYDDGSGPALVAGGVFTSAGGASASRIARWNGSAWSALGAGANDEVSALAACDLGGGPVLVAGGSFASAGGTAASAIASWNGSAWQPVMSGMHVTYSPGAPSVRALLPFDDGSGPRLFAGGHFDEAGTAPAGGCARFGNSVWSTLGAGLDGMVTSLAFYGGAGAPALYAGGSILHAGAWETRGIARWDSTHWSPLPPNPYAFLWAVTGLAVFDDGSGPGLFVSDLSGPNELTRWDGLNWSYVPNAPNNIRLMKVLDDGSGPAIYCVAAGTGIGLYRWSGTTWTSLGLATNGAFHALEVYDDGSGPALYAGGTFSGIGGQAANGIAKRIGTSWIPVGGSMSGTYVDVRCLGVHDDGTGPALYAGGSFDAAGGVVAHAIARWNGSSWSALGSGMAVTSGTPTVTALASFDDGSGLQLFAGGNFLSAGGVPSNGLAKWDGAAWTDLGLNAGEFTPNGGWIQTMSVADLGGPTGPSLLVGGSFYGAFGRDAALARWDLPPSCLPLGTSFCTPGSGSVMPCPCSNPAAGADRGCDNSSATGGAQLVATGIASLANDFVRLTTADERPSALSVFLQGTNTLLNGAYFGQGVRCVAGGLTRLYVKTAVNGSALAPQAGDPPVSVRSLALGDPIGAGQHRYYGVYYRDPFVLGGCPATSTFNITQQADLLWTP